MESVKEAMDYVCVDSFQNQWRLPLCLLRSQRCRRYGVAPVCPPPRAEASVLSLEAATARAALESMQASNCATDKELASLRGDVLLAETYVKELYGAAPVACVFSSEARRRPFRWGLVVDCSVTQET